MDTTPQEANLQSLSAFGATSMARNTSQQLMASELSGHMSFNHADLAGRFFGVSSVSAATVDAIQRELNGSAFISVWNELQNASSEADMYAPLVRFRFFGIRCNLTQ